MIRRGLVGSVLVLVGGVVTATLPVSTPVLRLGLLASLRSHEAGRMAGLVAVLLGLGLLASAWLRLCRAVAALPDAAGDAGAPGAADALATVRIAVAVWCLPLLVAPPLFSRDGWSYAAQGALARQGISPYEWGPAALLPDGLPRFLAPFLGPPVVQAVDPIWFDTVTPYGPVPIAFGALAAGFTGNPWLLVVAHRCLALVGLALLGWAVPRLARWTGADPALAAALVLGSPLVLANGVAGLHNDLLVAGLMAAALVVATERGWAWGAVLAGAAAAVKVPGGIVCVGIVLVSLPLAAPLAARLRRLVAVGAVAVGTLLGLGLVTGLGDGWVHALTVPGAIDTPLSATTLVGGVLDRLAGLVGVGTGPAFFHDMVRAAGLLTALGIGAWVVLRAPTGSRSTAVRTVAVAASALVLLSPVVHLWYFLLLPPFLLTQRLPRVASGTVVGLSVLLGLVAPLDSSLHSAYEVVVLATMTACLVLPVLLLTRPARERVARIVAPRVAAGSVVGELRR